MNQDIEKCSDDGEDRWSKLTNKIERYEKITNDLKKNLCPNKDCNGCRTFVLCVLEQFIKEMERK